MDLKAQSTSRVRVAITCAFIALGLFATLIAAPTADAATPAFTTFEALQARWLSEQSTSTLQTLARRHETLILKGRDFPTNAVATMEAANPNLKLLNYDEAYALSQSEAVLARPEGWIAETCAGEEIFIKTIPNKVLLDVRIDAARAWRIDQLSSQTNAHPEFDGSYLDSLGAYFPADRYSGTPCGLTNRQWLDASKNMVTRLKTATSKPVALNGAGFHAGDDYFAHKAAVDELIGVTTPNDIIHIEFFTRAPRASCTFYRPENSWLNDVKLVAEIGRQNRRVFASQKVLPNCTSTQMARLRDYGLGSFMLGAKPGMASLLFSHDDDTLNIDADNGWLDACGQPLGAMVGSAGQVRRRAFSDGCDIGVNPTTGQKTYNGVVFPARTAKKF